MSAYALPGLFPPIDTLSQSSSNDIKTIDDTSCTSEESSSKRNMPLHLQDNEVNSSASSNIGCILNSAAIAVKEAKIDPVRWIEYITGSNPQQYAHQIGKTLRKRVSNSSHSATTGSRSGGHANRTFYDSSTGMKGRSKGNGGSSCNSKSKSQQNAAIEFELSITFNGRKYTAKRTMQTIMQLRDDLIREMNRRRQWLTEKQDLSESALLKLSHGRRRFNDSNAKHSSSNKDNNQSYAVQIPEIPPFTKDHHHSGDTGFVGKGFTMLHAMVKSYVPVMESWLKSVMEVVPQDSECFMNFLWEPSTETVPTCFKSVLDSLNNNSNNDQSTCVSHKLKSSTSLATLGSIKEMECDSGDDDSEDGSDEYSASGWREESFFGFA
mmetsp:Transcript_14343/g.29683  ORF Transcript_14343/g.29683 Transcript_14343/m.29683 type:complete len:380 (+) Transcript_14343:205-1344(+)